MADRKISDFPRLLQSTEKEIDWVKLDTDPKPGLVRQIVDGLISDIVKLRENQILKVLSDNGYVFEDRKDFEHFAKTKCEIIRFEDSPKRILAVDGIALCEWWETTRIVNNFNVIVCIAGESPTSD